MVALKMLTPEAFGDSELVARFEREAEICSVLTHPNTVRLIHFGHIEQARRAPDIPYMAMEMVRGLPLGGLVKLRKRLQVEETSHVVAKLLDSLHDAHMNGIVHRDLKPNNILIEAPSDSWTEPKEGKDLFSRLGIPNSKSPIWQDLSQLTVKVVDFGLGKLLEIGDRQVRRLTRAGVGAGTAEYMSPEQVRGESDIDHRADIYGVAMLIYRLVTGEACFDGSSTYDLAIKHLSHAPPALPGELVDHPLNLIFTKASAKDREDRYATVEEMAWELRKAVDEDYLAVQALLASGMAATPDFEAPPEARSPASTATGAAEPAAEPSEPSEPKPEKKSLLSRLFKR